MCGHCKEEEVVGSNSRRRTYQSVHCLVANDDLSLYLLTMVQYSDHLAKGGPAKVPFPSSKRGDQTHKALPNLQPTTTNKSMQILTLLLNPPMIDSFNLFCNQWIQNNVRA